MNWGTQKYLGSLDRIANEVFNVNLSEGINYRIEFAINTYEKKVARLECMITGLKTENYDQKRFWGHIMEGRQSGLKDYQWCVATSNQEFLRLDKTAA